MQTEECMGDALRGQGRGKSQLKLALNSDGMLVNKGIDFKTEAEAFEATSDGRRSCRAQRAAKGQQQRSGSCSSSRSSCRSSEP
jgi:hypothetical protein